MSAEIELKCVFHQLDSPDELEPNERQLLESAIDARQNAYSPYSGFRVGAATLLEDGSVTLGNNQENVAYPSGLCAERVAVFAAVAVNPDIPIVAIAISASGKGFDLSQPVTPCGACRQVIAEYENRQDQSIRIIMQGETGPIYLVESIAQLLPLMFNEESLKRS